LAPPLDETAIVFDAGEIAGAPPAQGLIETPLQVTIGAIDRAVLMPDLNTVIYKNTCIQRDMGAREILSTTFGAGWDIGLGGLFADVGRDCDACGLEH
jgi:hypothetical protein